MRRVVVVACVVVSVSSWAASGLAFDDLLPRLGRTSALTALFGTSDARAQVRDGVLLGRGAEHTQLEQNGTLLVTRARTYVAALNPDTHGRVALPEPWQVHSTLVVSPALRLQRAETTLELHRSADRAVGFALSERLKALFAWDRAVVHASTDGKRLERELFLGGRSIGRKSFDYPRNAVPLDIVALVVAAAVKGHVDSFDFELLVPDGGTHGVAAVVHRTRDARPYLRGYRLPGLRLPADDEFAIVDMSLASPIKHLFYPHHFYFVYAAHDPSKLLALWGGDPDEPVNALRE